MNAQPPRPHRARLCCSSWPSPRSSSRPSAWPRGCGRAPTLREKTLAAAAPIVDVIRPVAGDPGDELVLPGNVEAFTDAPIYARTSGYVKAWYADIGTRVAKGQKLADIESPEVDQQLKQARADLQTAAANEELARITADRLSKLVGSHAVSQQEYDNAASAYAARRAETASAKANVGRLEQLVGFERIVAPFAGTITARNTDVGQLVDSGSAGGAARELFRIASTDKLRVFVEVPEVDSAAAKAGVPVELTFAERPGKRYPGAIARSADAIDPRHADAPRRGRPRQSEGRDPAGRVRAGPPEAGERDSRAARTRERSPLPRGGPAHRDGRRGKQGRSAAGRSRAGPRHAARDHLGAAPGRRRDRQPSRFDPRRPGSADRVDDASAPDPLPKKHPTLTFHDSRRLLMSGRSDNMLMRCARRWRLRHWLVVLGLALFPVAAIQGQAAPTEEPPKPALYSLPWLLRPAIPGTVLRLDETVGFYEDPVTGNSGVTYVDELPRGVQARAELGNRLSRVLGIE